MYKECLEQKEISSTMKQGVISLILKPDKDPLIISCVSIHLFLCAFWIIA